MFKVELQGNNVEVHTDNQNALRIIEVDTMISQIYAMLRLLFLRFVCYQEYLWTFVGFREMTRGQLASY